jgi:hypothetical protein
MLRPVDIQERFHTLLMDVAQHTNTEQHTCVENEKNLKECLLWTGYLMKRNQSQVFVLFPFFCCFVTLHPSQTVCSIHMSTFLARFPLV